MASNNASQYNNTRITHVSLSGIFSSPGKIEISLADNRTGKPISCLLYGENGSGKSSIIKAIEWSLQNRVNRTAIGAHTPRSKILNLLQPSGAPGWAIVETSDGATWKRSATWIDGENAHLALEHTDRSPAFIRSPIALTRADVLAFLDAHPADRGKAFLDYSLDTGENEPETDEVNSARNEILEVKQRIRAAGGKLALQLGQPEPYEIDTIRELIDFAYKGFPKHRRHLVNLHRRTAGHIQAIEADHEALKKAQQKLRRVKARVEAQAPRRITALRANLTDIDKWITMSFLTITRAPHIDKIRVEIGTSSATSLDMKLDTKYGTSSPDTVFSEGYRDLLAMLFYLAVIKVASGLGQARVLILDDVLQSVDSQIRHALTELIFREFSDWQIIVTVHDRLWREQLRALFRREGHSFAEIELRKWTLESGPAIVAANDDPGASLRSAIIAGDPVLTSSAAGLLLEQVCDVLSWTLPTSVQRVRGDRYTLGDLWPGIAKRLRKTEHTAVVESINRSSYLRNMVGAHYNEWALSITWHEAEEFGESTLALLSVVWCSLCRQWISRSSNNSFRCSCGNSTL